MLHQRNIDPHISVITNSLLGSSHVVDLHEQSMVRNEDLLCCIGISVSRVQENKQWPSANIKCERPSLGSVFVWSVLRYCRNVVMQHSGVFKWRHVSYIKVNIVYI